jgi:HEAT repeat protein
MNLLHLVQLFASTFTLLSLLMFLSIVLLRINTLDQQKRREEFLKGAHPHLLAYLAGEEGLEDALSVLGKNRLIALELLMEESDRMDRDSVKKLHPLFSGLSYLQGMLRDLGSRAWAVRLNAAERLGYLGEETSIPPLMRALGDTFLDVRLAASRALARLGCSEAILPIIRSLDLPGEISQRRIAEILSVLGEEAGEPLLKILHDSSASPSALCIAARTAGLLRLRRATPPLERLLTHPDEEVRINATRSLATLGDASSSVKIAEIREDPSWEVRSMVVDALGRLNDQSSIPLLTESLGDTEWWVRYHAARSLHRLGTPGLEALRNASSHHTDAFARDMCRQILEESLTLKPNEASV